MAFAPAGIRNAHEVRLLAHFVNAAAARIAHGGPQSPDELVHDCHQAPLVWDTAFDALGHELLELLARVLEIAI